MISAKPGPHGSAGADSTGTPRRDCETKVTAGQSSSAPLISVPRPRHHITASAVLDDESRREGCALDEGDGSTIITSHNESRIVKHSLPSPLSSWHPSTPQLVYSSSLRISVVHGPSSVAASSGSTARNGVEGRVKLVPVGWGFVR